MLGSLTTELGTLTYYDKFSSKQKLQVCKQETALGNKNLLVIVVYAYNFPMLGVLAWVRGYHWNRRIFGEAKESQEKCWS